jgi:uncharacterized repeat protein (TIGR03803 family)
LYLFNPTSNAVTVLHNFEETSSGYVTNTSGKLLEADNGKLYGVTESGGLYGDGVLFEYDLSTSTFNKCFDFDELVSGKKPVGTPLYASNGMIYGLFTRGGQHDFGGIYRYDPVINNYIIVADFAGSTDGEFPFGNLVEYNGSKLFGITQSGGANGGGLIFSYDLNNGMLSSMLDFDMTATGILSQSSLLLASDGMMYGSTQHGCANGFGGIFKYDPEANTISTIFPFTSLADRHQYGPMIEVESDFGIEDVSVDPSIMLYPNPVKQMLNVNLGFNLSGFAEIRIINSVGMEIVRRSCNLTEEKEIRMDISGMEKGVYFLQIVIDNQIYNSKFVKSE